MKIIEQFTMNKMGRDELNEDCLVTTPDFIAVMDGVTTKTCPEIDGRSGGRFAVDYAAAVIRGFAPDITARAAVDLLSSALHRAVAEKVSLPPQGERPAFAFIAYSRHRREVWRVADPYLIMDGIAHPNEVAPDSITSGARALMIEIALRKGATEADIARKDIGRDFIEPLRMGQCVFANRPGPYGYGVINGNPVPDEFLQIFDARQAHEIVFQTDGYPHAFRTLAESEAYLAAVLKEDPLLFRKHKSTKGVQAGNISFDDRTFVRFLTEGN